MCRGGIFLYHLRQFLLNPINYLFQDANMSEMSRISPSNQNMISICIPTYNRAKFLENLLDILINLPLPSYEIIVVDNHSTDYTCDIFKQSKYQKIKFFQNSENIGMTNNWNRCIELSSGKYIIIIHSDDSVSPDLFRNYLEAIKLHPDAGLVFSYPYIINEENEIIGIDKRLKGGLIFRGKRLYEILIPYNILSASGVLIKRDCLEKLGYFDNTLSYLPDHDMWLRITSHYPAIYINKPLSSYREHSENLYLVIPKKQYQKEKITVLKKQIQDLKSEDQTDHELLSYIEIYYRLLLVIYLKQFLSSKFSYKTLKSYLKLDLKLTAQIFLEFLIAFFQKTPYFENNSIRSVHFYPKWRFSIYLKSLNIFLRPIKNRLAKSVLRILLSRITKFFKLR
jgi:glycosyltransferase involved in cell wall biosynthesis